MAEYKEEEFLALSGIQHFVFCRRQWALIHLEQQWAENVRTVEGTHLHEKAHDTFAKEKRKELIISRGMPVFSKELGINGVCDVVEFHKDAQGVSLFGREGQYQPLPIEYKRGSPKESDADILQLTAQAMCLEEMLVCSIKQGYLYYGEPAHRYGVEFTKEYRERVVKMCGEMHQMYERRYTPKVKTGKSCKACSIADLCLPKLCVTMSVKQYIERNLDE